MNSLEKYTQAMFKLAPQGMIMPTIADESNLKKLFEVFAKSLKDVETEADQVVSELIPDNTGAFLTDWERVLGLPLAGLESFTAQQRLAFVKAWIYAGELSNKEFFIYIASLAGYTITIDEFTPLEPLRDADGNDVYDSGGNQIFVGNPPPSPALSTDAYLYFRVNYPAENQAFFRAGTSRAGERLVSYDTNNDILVFLIKYFKPAHAIALFNPIS
jgi:uncharacterized protein YmfQ (DUF2313 family)